MFAVLEAIDPPLRRTNTLKRRSLTGTLPGFRSLDLNLLNVPRTPKPQTSLEQTITTIGAIEKTVVIVVFTAQDLQTLPQPLGLI